MGKIYFTDKIKTETLAKLIDEKINFEKTAKSRNIKTNLFKIIPAIAAIVLMIGLVNIFSIINNNDAGGNRNYPGVTVTGEPTTEPSASTTIVDNDTQSNPAEWIASVDYVDMSGMNLYWESANIGFAADRGAKISLYVCAEKYEDELVLNDGQDWLLIMETAFGIYPLFPRSYVQLGKVSYVFYYADSGNAFDILHVLVTVSQTAGYEIYECIFDNAKQEFMVVPVYRANNINFWGGSH